MSSPTGLRERLTAVSPAARTGLLVEFILQTLCDELGIDKSELHPRSRFETLGVDSKRALEFKELLEEELRCSLRTTLMFDYPSPESLAAYVVRIAFGDAEGQTSDSGPESAARDNDGDGGSSASMESIEEQLRKKLEKYDI
jgi:acyl carrier protein